jgi:hypothetical protein
VPVSLGYFGSASCRFGQPTAVGDSGDLMVCSQGLAVR